jgi:hypothetical protein
MAVCATALLSSVGRLDIRNNDASHNNNERQGTVLREAMDIPKQPCPEKAWPQFCPVAPIAPQSIQWTGCAFSRSPGN